MRSASHRHAKPCRPVCVCREQCGAKSSYSPDSGLSGVARGVRFGIARDVEVFLEIE
jgi:hypothetical protein